MQLDPKALAKLSPQDLETLRAQARADLWRRGQLRYRLDETQQILYDRIKGVTSGRYFLNCSRRLGKSFVMLAVGVESCLTRRDARVLYIAPTAKDGADIATDNWLALSEGMPSDVKVEYKRQEKELIIAGPRGNGIIRFKATNGEHAKDLRGGRADEVLLDEAGTMDNFEHVLYSIVEPMTLSTGDKGRGRIIIATTPSETLGHDSHKVYESYAAKGLVSEFTLNDNPRIPYQEKFDMLERYGEDPAHIPDILAGRRLPVTTRAQREYYCRWVTEGRQAVVPEYFTGPKPARPEVLVALPPPPFRHSFTAMDPGMKDNTGILFSYWDWAMQRLVIQGEWLAPGAGTPEVAAAIADAEDRLYRGQAPAQIARVSDHEKRLVHDLANDYDLPFSLANKKDRSANIMLMRSWFQQRKIWIDPSCTNLDRQLQNAIHNRRGNDFERDEGADAIDGHYDLVAALYYLVRFVNGRKDVNPYPNGWLPRQLDEHLPLRGRKAEEQEAQRGSIFGTTPTARRIAKSLEKRGRRR